MRQSVDAGLLLRHVDHRRWPIPRRRWLLRQRWHDLLFAHWPAPVEGLRRLLPPGLDLDTFHGEAWISAVAFRMTGVTFRWLPSVPFVSSFPELNVRTYVRVGDKGGVYFFSLDAGGRLAVAVGRTWFHLPYYLARMSVETRAGMIHYSSQRRGTTARPAEFVARYRPSGPEFRAHPGTLDYWLTERYRLFAVDQAGAIYESEIHHLPWPLQPAEADITRSTVIPEGHALHAVRPNLRFARRLDSVAWAPTRMK